MAGLSWLATISAPESVLARRILRRIAVRVVEQRYVARRYGRALAHLLRRVVERHDPRSGVQDQDSGTTKVSPYIPLNLLASVLESSRCWRWSPYGHQVGPVQQDVRGLQHGIGVEPDARSICPALARLVLELRHARELTHSGYTVEEPGGVRRDAALAEDTDSGSRPTARKMAASSPDVVPEHLRVLGDRDGMQVHDAVVVVLVLYGHPVLEGTQVSPQVRRAARLMPLNTRRFVSMSPILTDAL